MHPPDQQLCSAASAGDEAAFGRLFERHHRAVYNHAFRLTGSWTVAEDVTQATFVTAWRRRGEGSVDSKPPAIGVSIQGAAALR